MDKDAVYREQEGKFVSTFMEELIPGVLHNFANPLNGIMGRAKLLQRRLEDSIKKTEACFPGFNQEFGSEKIIKDVNTISEESERFLKLFGDLAGKMQTLSRREPEMINLSRLIESEMRFADFYLDFKHELKKSLILDFDLPEIEGVAAEISLAFTNLLISAKERVKNSPVKELTVSTGQDTGGILLEIRDSGEAISEVCQQLPAATSADGHLVQIPLNERGFAGSLLLLKHGGASVTVRCRGVYNIISIHFPL